MQFKTIPVRDANGDDLIVYEVFERRLFGLVAESNLQLCSGERVEQFDRNTFVVLATGEKLNRTG